MLNKLKEYRCALFGCIGNDKNGENFSASLNKLNILGLLEINEKYSTSRCAVGIYQKERCLLADVNASCHLSTYYLISHQVCTFILNKIVILLERD